MPRYTVTCQQCGVEFTAFRTESQNPPQCCSRPCKAQSQRGQAWGWGKPAQPGENRPQPNQKGKAYLSAAARQRLIDLTNLPIVEAMRELYVARQMTIGDIATFAGTGHRTVRAWLDESCIPKRTPAEEKSLRMANLTPEERESLMSGCRAATRGAKQTDAHRQKIARTRQDRVALSGDEAEIMSALNSVGLNPVPLYAIHRYNIDFAFPDVKLAIEYNGGNWHNTPKKRRADEVKTAYLESSGWTVVFFPRLDKPQANDAGNERIAVDRLVNEVQRLIHEATHHSVEAKLE
jgi:very-short-patch-repair endonuclease